MKPRVGVSVLPISSCCIPTTSVSWVAYMSMNLRPCDLAWILSNSEIHLNISTALLFICHFVLEVGQSDTGNAQPIRDQPDTLP